MEKKTFYITTPIYYPNSNPHIGTAYTTIAADTVSRYKRMRGYDVRFLTGTDENAQKIARTAEEKGVDPKLYVDEVVAKFQELWRLLDISNDDFIRTTEPRHHAVVQNIFQILFDKGDIYKSEYQGWYCTPCETFWTENKLVEGKCPNLDCGREVELLKEESYFFKMSKYQDQLLQHIEDNLEFVQPSSRRNEMINFIKGGLDDLCVSRTTFKWGIPVPFDDKHVVYVWLDALINYISALGWNQGDEKFQRYWPAIHLMGKDIVRFHAVIWPITLLALGVELPKMVYGHGWFLNREGGKISKSRGNVQDAFKLIEMYGSDAIRYFLLKEMQTGSDGYYSEDALVERINSDLANDFGNLLSRTTAMIVKFRGGVIPSPKVFTDLDNEVSALAGLVKKEVEDSLDRLDFSNALVSIWRLIARVNKYVDETAPWALAKDLSKADELDTVLYTFAETQRVITILCTPFMPGVPDRVWKQLGISELHELHSWDAAEWGGMPSGIMICRGEPLFPRIEETKELADLKEPNSSVLDNSKRAQTAESKNKGSDEVESAEDQVQDLDPVQAEILFEDFAKLDLRVARIIKAEKVEKADKLLKLEVELGTEVRTVVSGIAKSYTTEELIGKSVVLVANLKPAKLRGIVSQGMILAASNTDKLEVIFVSEEMPSGARVK